MKIGFVGLGRMGFGMVENLLAHKHEVVVYNRSPEPTRKIAKKGAIESYSIDEMISKLPSRKTVWLMIPSSNVENILRELKKFLRKGDIVIDGGNSYFEDSTKRAREMKKIGVHFLDCGVSGGVWGARNGACMMIGGEKKAFLEIKKIFRDLCVKNGYAYLGKEGAGHFAKAVHNGIEYGMMASINEGFKFLEKNSKKFGMNLKEVAGVYANGSIIEGKLMKWLRDSFEKENYLDNISCEVPKGETEEEMKKISNSGNLKILKEAIKMREDSREGKICGDLISAMRNQFGGHAVKKK